MNIGKNLGDIFKTLCSDGLIMAVRDLKIKYSRHIGHKEIGLMPKIEDALLPLIRKYNSITTPITPINEAEKNIFFFWWDGFDNLPRAVSFCLTKLRENYEEKYNIIQISKYNYFKFAKLDSLVIEKFQKRKISIQTFADILRVKLILDNGGYWIDSTFCLGENFPFFKQLESTSFDSFYATYPLENNLVEYKGKIDPCLSFFLGGRKNSVIYSFIYEALVTYLKLQKKLPPYFLLDMIITLAMVYSIDDNSVNKIIHHEHDLYFVQRNENVASEAIDISELKLPQKLNWRSSGKSGTFLDDFLLGKIK